MKTLILSLTFLAVAPAFALQDDFQIQNPKQNNGTSLERLAGQEKPAQALPQGKYEGNKPAAIQLAQDAKQEASKQPIDAARDKVVGPTAAPGTRNMVQAVGKSNNNFQFEGDPKLLTEGTRSQLLNGAVKADTAKLSKIINGEEQGTVKVAIRVDPKDQSVKVSLQNVNIAGPATPKDPSKVTPPRREGPNPGAGKQPPADPKRPPTTLPADAQKMAGALKLASDKMSPVTTQLNNANRILTAPALSKPGSSLNAALTKQVTDHLGASVTGLTSLLKEATLPKETKQKIADQLTGLAAAVKKPDQTVGALKTSYQDLSTIRNVLLDAFRNSYLHP